MFAKPQKKNLKQRLAELFGLADKNEEFFERLEELLVQSDIGVKTALEISEELRARIKKDRLKHEDEYLLCIREIIARSLPVEVPLFIDQKPGVFLIVGVNGVGKTTTIAKMAHYYREKVGVKDIMLCAADTFRAAAVEQLKKHGMNLGIKVVAQESGSDPGAVVFDALTSAFARDTEMVLIDTAGRMHTKKNLIGELGKLHKIISSKMPKGTYKKILVLDATTGQNALKQAEVFHEAITIDYIVLAKFDSSAKGGIVVPISRQLGIPVLFLGTGEKMDSLVPFNHDLYFEKLFNHA